MDHRAPSPAREPSADLCVVTRHNVIKALTDGVFPGATPRLATNVIDTPRVARIVDALHHLGLRNSAEQRRVAGYVLGDLLDEGSGWQDYEGTSEQVNERYARARVYLVPEASSRERREQLVHAAQREAEVLNALSDHPQRGPRSRRRGGSFRILGRSLNSMGGEGVSR